MGGGSGAWGIVKCSQNVLPMRAWSRPRPLRTGGPAPKPLFPFLSRRARQSVIWCLSPCSRMSGRACSPLNPPQPPGPGSQVLRTSASQGHPPTTKKMAGYARNMDSARRMIPPVLPSTLRPQLVVRETTKLSKHITSQQRPQDKPDTRTRGDRGITNRSPHGSSPRIGVRTRKAGRQGS